MNKEAASIFEQSGCPSTRQLIDYLEGKLPAEQVHSVEAHLAGCAFCTEALEGFQQVEHKEQIPVIVKQIQGQLRRELEGHRSRKRRKKRYVWLSALIFIILIITLIAYFAIYFVMKRERSEASRREAPTTWVIPAAGAGAQPGGTEV
jgi:anti-sigma factor RsiW